MDEDKSTNDLLSLKRLKVLMSALSEDPDFEQLESEWLAQNPDAQTQRDPRKEYWVLQEPLPTEQEPFADAEDDDFEEAELEDDEEETEDTEVTEFKKIVNEKPPS